VEVLGNGHLHAGLDDPFFGHILESGRQKQRGASRIRVRRATAPVFVGMDEIGFQNAIEESRNAAAEFAWPQPILERGVGFKNIAEFEAVGFAVGFVAQLAVDLKVKGLVGEDGAAEHVPRAGAGLHRRRKTAQSVPRVVLAGRRFHAQERRDAKSAPRSVVFVYGVAAKHREIAEPLLAAVNALPAHFQVEVLVKIGQHAE